jgi:3-oxoacyl-[acyl-carrier protein] reductase
MELAGKVALVTGGGTGIGRATALGLARAGCHVAVNYSRSEVQAIATAEEAEALGVTAMAVKADVSDDRAVRGMVADVGARLGRLDIVVNSAGVTSFKGLEDLEGVTDEDWRRILDVNLKGPFQVIRAAVALLRANADGGSIVNVSSVAGVYGLGSSIPYCASKGGLNTMTLTFARELAPRIRVNAVAPGFVDTEWWNGSSSYEATKARFTGSAPLRRAATAEDVAAIVVGVLCSEVMTGQVVVVDSGMGIVLPKP